MYLRLIETWDVFKLETYGHIQAFWHGLIETWDVFKPWRMERHKVWMGD